MAIFTRQVSSAVGHLCLLSLCDSHYFYRDLFEKNLIVLTHVTLILFSEMVCQWTALRCLLRICCQRILKYQDRRKPSDSGSTVLELWHMLITCLRMSEMGKVQKTVLGYLISLLILMGGLPHALLKEAYFFPLIFSPVTVHLCPTGKSDSLL